MTVELAEAKKQLEGTQRSVCALVRARLEDGWWPTRAQLEVLLSAVEQDGPGRDPGNGREGREGNR